MTQSYAELNAESDKTILDQPDVKIMSISAFTEEFGESLMNNLEQQNPPVYDGKTPTESWNTIMDSLVRKPFDKQRNVVHAISTLLVRDGEPSGIINAEMGTGKTMMGICASNILHHEGFKRALVLSPPHLCYKWRREILETVPKARVWVLNGPETLLKLIMLRERLDCTSNDDVPEYFVLGRVRMRMGFNWEPSFTIRKQYKRMLTNEHDSSATSFVSTNEVVSCSVCGSIVVDRNGDPLTPKFVSDDKRSDCKACSSPMWTLTRPAKGKLSRRELVKQSLCKLPTIGPKTADKLMALFGEDSLHGMLADNVHNFINLMDASGNMVFTDRQAARMERSIASVEFSFGQGGYQPTEYIKRYLPKHYFGVMIVDEGHEYKSGPSAQGQAMGVLATQIPKSILLTGSLIGGYASDFFYLAWRIFTKQMISDGYGYNGRRSLGSAEMRFMRRHGVLKDIYKESDALSHKTARGKRVTVRTAKAPGFSPQGIAQYVLPYTSFLKLRDIGAGVLPPYNEHLVTVPMTEEQFGAYRKMESVLSAELKHCISKGDNSLLGVVMNALLAWPECCFRDETIKHPQTRDLIHYQRSLFADNQATPKELKLIDMCKHEKSQGRRVLVYTTYTGKRDTGSRLKALLSEAGLKTVVLRSSVESGKREDWIQDQVERGIDVLVCNPELVKTGLDLLEFPAIMFMQTGYNVYTIIQASRRSWRIGQEFYVDVFFLGYEDSAQIGCLELMNKKIAVTQSTSGDIPANGLDALNTDGDSIEVELAKQLLIA